MSFASVEQLIEEISRGGMVILIDDASRENEGDLVLAAESITAEQVNFLATHARGLICAPLAPEIVERLQLPSMHSQPSDPNECSFTISVDARDGVSTGISAFDRAHTLRQLAHPDSTPEHFNRPGHMFPLKAKAGGILSRQGHTEASVHLMRRAGLQPAAVICEVMNADGSMARLEDLQKFAKLHGLLLGTIDSMVAECRQSEIPQVAGEWPSQPKKLSSAQLPTPYGLFEIESWSVNCGEPITVLRQGHLQTEDGTDAPLVRIHSACFTGDVIGSLRCDCGSQLQMALDQIGSLERGALLYMPQEGRGIGLTRKIQAYHLQQHEGLDTVEANERLGFPPDMRDYSDAAAVLGALGATQVRLLTNNPAKVEGLVSNGIEVSERLSIEPEPGPVNLDYLRVKKNKMGHIFEAI
ncbi:MAG: 3,4-dihydroxy-2-butanone-4-phosphate synthase [Planctomycetota bacterium]|nr:3,4-dihydroxy-2-butanone-4-phosphate synthase [Planctomycetota bacterium]